MAFTAWIGEKVSRLKHETVSLAAAQLLLSVARGRAMRHSGTQNSNEDGHCGAEASL